MRKFNIKVNGKSYEVEVEEIRDGVVVNTPVSAPAPAAKPAPTAAAPKANVPSGATKVSAPMPGNILSINVKAGDQVKKGDILCILEAMKMENEILAPNDGTVAAVNVTKGAAVNTGDVLVAIG